MAKDFSGIALAWTLGAGVPSGLDTLVILAAQNAERRRAVRDWKGSVEGEAAVHLDALIRQALGGGEEEAGALGLGSCGVNACDYDAVCGRCGDCSSHCACQALAGGEE